MSSTSEQHGDALAATSDVPTTDIDLLADGAVDDPHRVFRDLRGIAPIVWSTRHRAWIVTTHEEVRLAFHDLRLSSDRLTPLERRLSDDERALMGDTFDLLRGWMVFHDPPDHERLREPLRRTFTPARVTDLRPRVEAIVDELLVDVASQLAAGDTVDLVASFAFPLPAIVIAELLGVPVEDRAEFKTWSDELAAVVFGTADRRSGIEQAAAGSAKFAAYFGGLIERYTADPADNLISALIAVTNDEPGLGLSSTELVGALTLLLFGGHETTTNLISNSYHSLLRDPTALAKARTERNAHLRTAMWEELHRFDGSTKVMVRVVAEDHERAGVTMRAGETVLLGVLGANRDPAVFATPDTIDLSRDNARQHVGFGYGRHFCLGAALARLEADVALGRLVDLLDVKIAGDVQWSPVLLGRGHRTLPVESRP
ncbi:MAG: cytochrome P450 [Actinomycetota bacterium]